MFHLLPDILLHSDTFTVEYHSVSSKINLNKAYTIDSSVQLIPIVHKIL